MQKENKNKRKKNLLIIGVLLLSVAVIGVTIAYFSASFSVTEEIKTADFAYRAINRFNSPGNWLPGDTANPTLTVTNTANTPIAIRAKITETWVSGNSTTLSNQLSNGEDAAIKTFGSSWKKIGNYYYYNGVLNENQTTATSLITAVTFNENAGENISCEEVEGEEDQHRCSNTSGYGGATYTITVAYDIMQASAIEDSWGVTQASIATSSYAGANVNIKGAYSYVAGQCEENDSSGRFGGTDTNCQETLCFLDGTAGSCPKGTIIDYQVDATTTDNTLNMAGASGILRFHVLYDNGSTMVLQMNKNLASLNGTKWYSGGDDATKGPATILPALESATSGWTNVNNQTYTLGTDVFGTGEYATAKVGCIGQNGPVTATKCNYDTYTSETIDANLGGLARTAKKARLITANEAGEMGCQIWVDASCPKWMFNYLNYHANGNATFYPVNESGSATDLAGNYAYWTSSARSDNTTDALLVHRIGQVDIDDTTSTGYGARPVIVINK